MLPEFLKFEILTPFKKIYSADVKAVRLPGLDGYFGVYPGHTPFLAALKVGEIKVEADNRTSYFSTTGGFVEVLPHSISVLAEVAEAASLIDIKRAQEARDRAKKRLEEGRMSWDVQRAKLAMLRAINRIRIASKE
ncbi:MAG: F0F1 ATP synthase subunit epsilon [bacterium]